MYKELLMKIRFRAYCRVRRMGKFFEQTIINIKATPASTYAFVLLHVVTVLCWLIIISNAMRG